MCESLFFNANILASLRKREDLIVSKEFDSRCIEHLRDAIQKLEAQSKTWGEELRKLSGLTNPKIVINKRLRRRW